MINDNEEPLVIKNPDSAILPDARPVQNAEVTRQIVEAHRHLLPKQVAKDDTLILAVRGYYSKTFKAAGNDRGVYDDAIFVVLPDRVVSFNANTDSSNYKTGVANLKAPQGVGYIRGKHGLSRSDGGYMAFRQATDVVVVRDKQGEDKDSAGKRFWTNLHRGGITGTSSLGCITVPPHQWDEFRDLLYSVLDRRHWTMLGLVLLDYDGNNPPISKVAEVAMPNVDDDMAELAASASDEQPTGSPVPANGPATATTPAASTVVVTEPAPKPTVVVRGTVPKPSAGEIAVGKGRAHPGGGTNVGKGGVIGAIGAGIVALLLAAIKYFGG